jgi:RNA polymerase sigma-70 factor, ECF subfamily
MTQSALWQRWFEDHAPALILLARQWCANPADAEDAVQEAFIRTWQNRDTVRDPGAYLFQATRSAALDLLRKKKRAGVHENRQPTPAPMFESPLETDDRCRQIQALLTLLPDEQREVLVMKVWGGLTFPQIAQALDIPPNTAASRYRYALQALKNQLTQDQV